MSRPDSSQGEKRAAGRTDRVERETLRYLGYGGRWEKEADGAVRELIASCVNELQSVTEPVHLCREYPLILENSGIIDFGCFQTESRHLYQNLQDCERVLLFAATLGAGVDHLLCKYGRLQMSRAVVIQAAAAALLEEYCDEQCRRLRESSELQGWYLRPRFSPGYGDFSLSCQPMLLDALEAGKRIGIKLTDSFLMLPSKSVTAVMGLGRKPQHCTVKGCEVCGKMDCLYRRDCGEKQNG